ncbi:MAG: branched-chain amino acid ABC transporter permease [Deltaproteobacteria bacterium]|nr:branched-chain amino acid ABC transporter permease [Deltaproteobacteria bacterium]
MNRGKKISLIVYLIIIILMFLLPLFLKGPYVTHILILTVINIILSTSLRLITLTGLMSLATGGMMTLGAYTSTLLVIKLGFSTWLALLLAGVMSAVLACLAGFPFSRLKGIYFAIVTVFLSEMLALLAEQWRSLTGGSSGIYNIPRPDPIIIPGVLNLTFSSKVSFYYLICLIMLLTLLVLYAIEHSRIGMTLNGIRQSDSLAESIGINCTGYKVLAFTIACFFPGVAGGFYAHYISTINPTTFGFLFTIYVIIYLVVGGMKSFIGPIIGAFIFTILPEVLRPLKEFQPYFFAGALMFVLFFMPEGLVGLPKRIKTICDRFLNKKDEHA